MARLTARARETLARERRSQILEAAVAVFSEAGYEGATIRAIGRRAGLAEGTIYLYFPSKRDLLLGAWEHVALSALRGAIEHLDRAEAPDDEDLLTEIFRTQFETLRRHDAFLRLVMHRADVDPEFLRIAQQRVRELKVSTERHLRERIRKGAFARVEVPIAVAAIAAILRGIPLFDRYDPDPLFARYPVGVIARELARLVLYGLVARPLRRRRPSSGGGLR